MASVVCDTVNTPSTAPASLPSMVPEMLTVALSPSRISMLSVAVPIEIPGSLSVMPVSVMVTDSVPSTRLSATMPVTLIVADIDPPGIVTEPASAG